MEHNETYQKSSTLIEIATTVIDKSPYIICVSNLKNLSKDQKEYLCHACETVENACWSAQEQFSCYFAKNDVISYVVYNDKIIGFLLATHWQEGETAICSLEEMMILDEHRGHGFWRLLVQLVNNMVASFYIKSHELKNFCNIANTCNPAVMMMAKKSESDYFASNFTPNPDVIRIANNYIKTNKLTALEQKHEPFYLKNSFPGCSKIEFSKNHESMKNLLPEKFSFSRGDSMLAVLMRKLHIEYSTSKQILHNFSQLA